MHGMLQEHSIYLSRYVDRTIIHAMRRLTTPSLSMRDQSSPNQVDGHATSESIAQLNDAEHGEQTVAGSRRQYTDPTLFDLTIMPMRQHGPEYLPARGKMDTGAECNVIDLNLVKKAKLEDQLEDVDEPVSFSVLDDIKFIPKKRITLHWRLPNDRKARTTEFYLANNSWFELIYGLEWIEHNADVSQKVRTMLPLVKEHHSKCKYLQVAMHNSPMFD